ncbi:sugar kinase [Alicyclobacillus dauci]|uniref:Sugar kinase n=1 Tax=Alicyclobacillus dauci TaxID=1475485 RepID=A0ABY6Z6X8_9BACL|nr:sugar kinase [Alicyclobacillus dauci]WAH38031.1 sugar kinase [Alicyclobacillus dauci]
MDVVTIGETMVLLTPDDSGSLEQAVTFTKHLAGAESNVSIALARLGHHVSWLSKVGADGFGRYILKTLRGEGVDVSRVVIDESRSTGVFFKETSPFYGTSVQYYRENSAASEIRNEDVDRSLLHDARVFHVTGVTPALSLVNRKTLVSLLEEARRQEIRISFDPNIRYKLWSIDEAIPVLHELATYADIVLPGLDEGKVLTGQTTPEGIADWFLSRGCELVVVKLGPQGAYYQTVHERGYVDGFEVTLVDEVGAGDAFAAGLLSGLLDNLKTDDSVRRACALGAMAVCGKGDYETLPRRRELMAFMTGKSKIVNR